jgi:hypothetical protein
MHGHGTSITSPEKESTASGILDHLEQLTHMKLEALNPGIDTRIA